MAAHRAGVRQANTLPSQAQGMVPVGQVLADAGA